MPLWYPGAEREFVSDRKISLEIQAYTNPPIRKMFTELKLNYLCNVIQQVEAMHQKILPRSTVGWEIFYKLMNTEMRLKHMQN